ncbi:hypothetical protein L2E82_45227 [Cichorium intybus]|uniref:Uncharacterized protein n=1 Tax=Cichorium intybus TaxID=13427 RepID=A0ACB8ZSY2_CICIN|nr:hypothetical protein L2E82_45227 [Cichorium intybus]
MWLLELVVEKAATSGTTEENTLNSNADPQASLQATTGTAEYNTLNSEYASVSESSELVKLDKRGGGGNGGGQGELERIIADAQRVASSVTKLEIGDISGLTDELWRGVIKNLGKVEEISMRGCNEIRYLWESEADLKAGKVLVNLRKLKVDFCSNLVSLGEKEEAYSGSNIIPLRSLDVYDCGSLQHCSCPDSIESLSIWSCGSITSVSFTTGGGQKLQSVTIWDCKKLLEKELGGGEKKGVLINSSMRMLQSIDRTFCQNLKSITQLKYFIHLTRLNIVACPSLVIS